MEQFAVITGASRGLGKAFALELAQRKINTILVSLPNEEVKTLSAHIQEKYGTTSYFYETDLSVLKNVLDFAKWVNERFNVFVLINNAGIGGTNHFTKVSVGYIHKILQLNIVATSVLTHQLLPNLLQQPNGYILNVSSIAAFLPMGYKTVYPASKAYIHSFTRGLYQELKNTNVFVSVVNPGAMKTNAEISGRIEKQGFLSKLILLDPEKVAVFCIRQLFRKDTVIMVNAFGWLLLQILPVWIKLPIITRAVKREIDKKL